jgi:hypothetical protein
MALFAGLFVRQNTVVSTECSPADERDESLCELWYPGLVFQLSCEQRDKRLVASMLTLMIKNFLSHGISSQRLQEVFLFTWM